MLALLHKVSLGIAATPVANLFKHRTGTLDCFGFSGSFRNHRWQVHDPVDFNPSDSNGSNAFSTFFAIVAYQNDLV